MAKYDKALMKSAYIWAEESYCKRRKVGCVISKNGRIIATGYNGTISGTENICEEYEFFKDYNDLKNWTGDYSKCQNCIDGIVRVSSNNPYLDDYECPKCNGIGYLKLLNKTNEFTLHAEQNALMFCVKHGLSTEGCDIHVTTLPCKNCAKLIAQAGIKRVVYDKEYHDTSSIEFFKKVDIEVMKYTENQK